MRIAMLSMVWLMAGLLHAQAVTLRFVFTYGDAEIVEGRSYAMANGDSVRFENLKMYISGLRLYDGAKPKAKALPEHLLVQMGDGSAQLASLVVQRPGRFDRVVFDLGIDSTTSVSGAMGGALDPTQGMYWAWQSGYVFFKLEGQTAACPARNHMFQFHLGGYAFPYNALQKIVLPVHDPLKPLVIALPIDALLAQIDLRETYEIMSPNAKAVALMQTIAGLLKVVE